MRKSWAVLAAGLAALVLASGSFGAVLPGKAIPRPTLKPAPSPAPTIKQLPRISSLIRGVRLRCDLTVSIAAPSKAVAGQSIDVKVTVKNVGPGPAPGTLNYEPHHAYMVDLVLSSDGSVPIRWAVQPVYAGKTREDFVEDMLTLGGRVSRTSSIAAGQQAVYALPVYIPKGCSPGVYQLAAVVDPGKNVNETDEGNNVYKHTLEISPPAPEVIRPPAGITNWVMPYGVGGTTLDKIKPSGVVTYTDWMSEQVMVDAPFAGYLGFRHGASNNIPSADIKYYRWMYKRDGNPSWREFTESVGVHYVKESPGSPPIFPVYVLGPKAVNGMYLYEFKPATPPEPGTHWPTTDIFGDIYSGFLGTEALAEGGYKIRLEVFSATGARVAVGPATFQFVVPDHTGADGALYTRLASGAQVVDNGFEFALHIDNRPCFANIDAPAIGATGVADECGFLRYDPADATKTRIRFTASHPANFARFSFSAWRGADWLGVAGAAGEVTSGSAGRYAGDGVGNFSGEFARAELLGPTCQEGAFSLNLYAYAKATTGWGHRINKLDAWDVRAFALAPN